jgi:signal transduction histidine kinase
MKDLGMFQFMLPFMLSSAIFYGLLRKSQIFGDPRQSITVNAVVALVASFMVWSAPILLGIDIQTSLASFFVQGVSATLIIMVGLLIVGMIAPPDLPEHFRKVFEKNTKFWMAVLVGGILVGVIVAVSSGLMTVIFPQIGGVGGVSWPTLSENTIEVIGVVLLLVIPLVLIIALG